MPMSVTSNQQKQTYNKCKAHRRRYIDKHSSIVWREHSLSHTRVSYVLHSARWAIDVFSISQSALSTGRWFHRSPPPPPPWSPPVLCPPGTCGPPALPRCSGKIADGSCQLSDLQMKPGFKIMMMGSLEEDIADASTPPEDMPDVLNDLDIEDEEVAIENTEVHLAKIERRVKTYSVKVLNDMRPGKKLLVLDIDYTLFDHRSVAENGYELMRPYLHEFLSLAYMDYDIVIWSATSMKWIEEKMKLLGVSTHTKYKIAFYLDSLAMISVHTPKYGVVQVKPLGVIWGKFEHYTPKNTIMFDDIRRNFIMNPGNGLKIRPFKQAHTNRHKDQELLMLASYLRDILDEEDFSNLDHKNWEKYRPKKKRDTGASKEKKSAR